MAYRTDPRLAQARVAVGAVDEGLRSYMLSVYNYMGLGLAITGHTVGDTVTYTLPNGSSMTVELLSAEPYTG